MTLYEFAQGAVMLLLGGYAVWESGYWWGRRRGLEEGRRPGPPDDPPGDLLTEEDGP